MTTMSSHLITITDDAGNPLLAPDERYEPEPGSVVLVKGAYGTAWQRFFSTGRWHPVRGNYSLSWEQMLASPLTNRNLVLVYDAPKREVSHT